MNKEVPILKKMDPQLYDPKNRHILALFEKEYEKFRREGEPVISAYRYAILKI